jgi:hypothetical protein
VRRLLIALALLAVTPLTASADDGIHFHRTTPRAVLDEASGILTIGVPGGRAWGIESDLRPLPAAGTTLVVRLSVDDDEVREAFVRVAYYAQLSGRSRQLETADGPPVEAGAHALALVTLDPPPGAVAFRIRVLARLREPGGRSADDAVRARVRIAPPDARAAGSLFSRLLD